MLTVDKDSYNTLAVVFVAVAVFIGVVSFLIHPVWIKWALIAFALVFFLWQLFFFRVPDRVAAGNGTSISSAADGKVVIVDEYFEDEYLKRPCRRVCVYMDFFDVHANFWPVTGTVDYYRYHPGKHFLAFKPKASEENEHSTTCIRTAEGVKILFRQHAGTFARRIVNYAKPGLKVVAGQQCGIIKFGSRLDLFFPLDATVKVAVGDHVWACESVIAVLQ